VVIARGRGSTHSRERRVNRACRAGRRNASLGALG